MAVEIKSNEQEGAAKVTGDPGAGASAAGITIGDKTFTAQDVEQMVASQNALQEKIQSLQVVEQAAAKYGIDTGSLVKNAEGAFEVLSRLIDEGVIDQAGVTVKKGEDGGSGNLSGISGIAPNIPAGNKVPDAALAGLASLQELKTQVDQILQKVESIDKTQSSIIRTNLEKELLNRYPVLGKDGTSRAIAMALRDRSKDVFTHAAGLAREKESDKVKLREEFAKEFGVNLQSIDENKLLEQGPEGGAAALFKDKKISFRNKGEGFVSPLQATRKFLNMKFR